MRILIAMGSFKDVYSPIEMTQMVGDAIIKAEDISLVPMCDGGEYTFDVISFHCNCQIITVDNIINPYGKRVKGKYLAVDDEAYVISSEILHLSPGEEEFKNPLLLTDYGLGQLVDDALCKGFKTINLCLGGTSTVCFGMGFAQALGVEMLDKAGRLINEPITPLLLKDVEKVRAMPKREVTINVINDGITSAHDLPKVNPQKIGTLFLGQKENILCSLDRILRKVCSLTGVSIDTAYAGNAGGVCFGIECILDAKYIKGTEYFMDIFGVKDKIVNADIIITGEGKLDNVHVEKLPVVISKTAKSFGKKCIFICGQRGELEDDILLKYGIEDIICCKDHYCKYDDNYIDSIDTYKNLTPIIIRKELGGRFG